mmetsp:Transcript_26511/g.41532  ORF Transcript_26511/g.41532 Transcript_26511/m.41532 type:complete len:242 (-) Transcript_26511:213-938(-)
MFRPVYCLLALAGAAEAFMGSAPLAGSVAPKLRAGACSQLKMVDWSEPSKEEEYTGAGSDRGQMNKADEIWDRVNNRIVSAASEAEAKGVGQKSGLDPTGKLREGDRDPHTGRVIVDPLKIPTAEQGAPGSWAEYMAMRQQKEGGQAKDAMGNVIDNAGPSYAVQPGTWGAPKDADPMAVASADRSVTGFQQADVSDVVDDEAAAWRAQKDAERAQQEAETEAKMQEWLRLAAEKRAREGQ